MDYTIADGVVVAILFVSGVLAWSRGFTREALAIGGWIVAGAAAIYLAPMVEPLLHEIPQIGEVLSRQCTLSKLSAFTAMFAAGLIVLSIFTPLFSHMVQDSPLGVFDKGLGFLFGVARGLALIVAAYLLYDQFVGEPGAGDASSAVVAAIEGSYSIGQIRMAAAELTAHIPTTIPAWAAEPVNELMRECGGVPGLVPEAPAASGA